ncbi:MAG: NAD-dependent epimerase/dehydratase family protein [Chloroflexaceae bacterium]|jgi:nucleoside-diphosphate-sugar epimerase|nr:NAD-dependent epimerase/dehydratase family protein [Chloroflexaceae bacterium]
MAHYLIAGAAGYVGSRLAQALLARGHRVRGLVRNADDPLVEMLAAQGMVVWTGDITRPETLVGVADGIDHVYNLTSRLVLENGSVRKTFVDGNLNLIAACSRSRSVQSYCFTSRAAVYGDAGDSLVGEDAPVAPCYPLGQVMADAERTIMEQVQRHRIPAMILRIGTIYGPERDFVDAVQLNTETIFGNGRNFASPVHIDDLLTILMRLPDQGQPGAIYNVADDSPVRLLDLYSEVHERLGMLPPRTFNSDVALNSGLDPSIVGSFTASVRLDNARIKHDLQLELRYPSYRHWLDERLGVQELELAV